MFRFTCIIIIVTTQMTVSVQDRICHKSAIGCMHPCMLRDMKYNNRKPQNSNSTCTVNKKSYFQIWNSEDYIIIYMCSATVQKDPYRWLKDDHTGMRLNARCLPQVLLQNLSSYKTNTWTFQPYHNKSERKTLTDYLHYIILFPSGSWWYSVKPRPNTYASSAIWGN